MDKQELLKYLEIDIESLTNHPERYKIPAMMNKISLDEYVKIQLDKCIGRKNEILNELDK